MLLNALNSSIDILYICCTWNFIKDNCSNLTKESRKEKLLSIESYRPKISFILSGIYLRRTKKTRSICITEVDIINVPNIVQLYVLAYSFSNMYLNVLTSAFSSKAKFFKTKISDQTLKFFGSFFITKIFYSLRFTCIETK